MTILPLQASAIGIAMAINGIWTIACQVLFLNRLRRLLGVSLSYKLLSLGWPLVWFFMPLLRNVLTSTESPVPPLQDVPDTKTSHHRYHPVIYPEERAWPTTICVNLYLMFATVVAMSSSFDGTRELLQPRQDCTWGYQWDRYGCRRKYTTTAPSFTRYTDVTC